VNYIWLYLTAGRRSHALPAGTTPGRYRMSVCGTSPHWASPTGWQGLDDATKTRAARLDRCGRCTRILATAGGAR